MHYSVLKADEKNFYPYELGEGDKVRFYPSSFKESTFDRYGKKIAGTDVCDFADKMTNEHNEEYWSVTVQKVYCTGKCTNGFHSGYHGILTDKGITFLAEVHEKLQVLEKNDFYFCVNGEIAYQIQIDIEEKRIKIPSKEQKKSDNISKIDKQFSKLEI